ncbi:kinase-like domain-containing protein [Hypoxylon sp. FL0890]|nr:kinase-like domain-containing protein [Hypoxylon sp. FL0890]
MDAANLQRLVDEIKTYFSRDSRFYYRGHIASGRFGVAHRVQYRQNENGFIYVTDFLVKTAHKNSEAEGDMENEKAYLKRLRGGAHIVQLIDVPDDPLTKYKFEEQWKFLILEWVPNGTLCEFIFKARNFGCSQLPNRLLWRFFLCLISGLCGLAWPRNRQGGRVEIETPMPWEQEGNVHNDLHTGNVLLGDFDDSREHGFTPVLKIIDFGKSFRVEEEDLLVANEANLWDVGHMTKLKQAGLLSRFNTAANRYGREPIQFFHAPVEGLFRSHGLTNS